MPGKVTITTGVSGALARLAVIPVSRENCAIRGSRVDLLSGSTIKASTGFRLGIRHLLGIPASTALNARAAVRDANGLWTEWSGNTSVNYGNATAGSGQGSIASAATFDRTIQNPGIVFPDLSKGSGRMTVRRTLISGGFFEEVGARRWSRGRAAFRVKLEDLDEWQTLMLHRLWRATNGGQRVFFFDYVDPEQGVMTTAPATRYVVRFRDDTFKSGLFAVDRSEIDANLIEVLDDPEGGDV